MGPLPPLLSSWSRCDSWIVLQWLRFYLIASSLLLLSDSSEKQGAKLFYGMSTVNYVITLEFN